MPEVDGTARVCVSPYTLKAMLDTSQWHVSHVLRRLCELERVRVQPYRDERADVWHLHALQLHRVQTQIREVCILSDGLTLIAR